MQDIQQRIDKRSPIPAYHQIASDLMARIDGGEWERGDKLPSEDALSAQYDVSRITLRQALSVLEDGGLITRLRGKGAYLTGQTKPFVEDLNFPILGERKREQSRNESRLLELRYDEAPPSSVRRVFGTEGAHAPLVYLCRIFVREGRPLGLNRAWFPAEQVPGLVEEGLVGDSITTTLSQRYQYRFQKIENYIEASSANAGDAALLDCPYNASVLKIQSTYVLEKGGVIEYASTLWRGNLTRFHLVVEEKG